MEIIWRDYVQMVFGRYLFGDYLRRPGRRAKQ
jgi:hypothetical protein